MLCLKRATFQAQRNKNMKKLLLSTALCFAFLAGSAQDNTKPVGGTGPMITFDKEVHDYGTIAYGGNGECTFTVTNTGDQPLILTNCKGSCGCTVPSVMCRMWYTRKTYSSTPPQRIVFAANVVTCGFRTA